MYQTVAPVRLATVVTLHSRIDWTRGLTPAVVANSLTISVSHGTEN